MSKPLIGHPGQEELLRYADGEAPAAAVGQIRSHLEACWQCRVELEELQATVGECVRYRKNVLQRHLPPPPSPWMDIRRRFAEIDAELDHVSLRDRLAGVLGWAARHAVRWAPVAVALLIAWGLTYRFRDTPTVEAAELLRKAIAAADGRPAQPRRIQIRTRDRHITRFTGVGVALNSGSGDSAAIAELFRVAHYDWDNPLSAKSYQAWREQLSGKRDEVIAERDGYRILTYTQSGELAEASLKIGMPGLRPVEERLEFRNRDWIEITEIAAESTPASSETVEAATHPAERHTNEMTPAASPESPATISDELRVLAALHRVGADLGDPIEVSRSGSGILVAGVGIEPQRQQEIRDALSSQKRAVLRFSESAAARVPPDADTPGDSAAGSGVQQLQDRMAERIGGHVQFTELAAQVLDLSEPMMSRAYALRLLAERIPVQAESELRPQDRRLLRSIEEEHTAALRRQLAGIDRVLKPVLDPVPAAAAQAGVDAAMLSGSWQSATEDLFQSARRVDKLLAMMFGAAPAEANGEALPLQLRSSLARLRASLDAYDRLPAQALDRSDK